MPTYETTLEKLREEKQALQARLQALQAEETQVQKAAQEEEEGRLTAFTQDLLQKLPTYNLEEIKARGFYDFLETKGDAPYGKAMHASLATVYERKGVWDSRPFPQVNNSYRNDEQVAVTFFLPRNLVRDLIKEHFPQAPL